MSWLVFAAACAAGCVFHFLYVPLGRPRLLQWLLPVNESPWEHFKLAFWPLGAGLFAVSRLGGIPAAAWVCAWAYAATHGFFTMTGIYYFYRAALGVPRPVLWADISNYFITMFFGWMLGLRALTYRPGTAAVLPAAVCLTACAVLFVTASETPPPNPLFREERRK